MYIIVLLTYSVVEATLKLFIAFQAIVLLAKGAMSTHSPSRSLHSEFC